MPNAAYIVLIPLLPLAGFVLLGLFGRKYFRGSSGVIGTVLLLGSTVLALWVAYGYFSAGADLFGVYKPVYPLRLPWLVFSDRLSIDLSIILDPISVMMIVIVTVVSLMVHIFSLGYMRGEERFATYYAFLGLFTFSMLGLVLSENIFTLFIFWELVGVSSYLLIGYHYDRPSAVTAAKKAFIVTRFADLSFLIGILMLGLKTNTFDIRGIMDQLFHLVTAPDPLVSLGLILIFIGGAGKSALFPLHIWLPDAMEGPTPVSALIHAATMVVAGVYLVARLYLLYIWYPSVMELILYVGVISAMLAAIIACTQTDIKRVLAYSTMSQIGFMIFALGAVNVHEGTGDQVGWLGFSGSMFHLFTHAFFKALLFLCAGVIIHLVHSNEMKDMGGLRKRMPFVHVCFLIGCLAISGIPPFAGFFSKEEILAATLKANKLVYALALFTSGLTAFYMFRLYFSIFWGKREEEDARKTADGHAHGGHHGIAFSMKLPLLILAAGSIFAGFVPVSDLVSPGGPLKEHPFGVQAIAPVGIALLGIILAGYLYKRESNRPARARAAFGGLYRLASHKFYIDELYYFVTKKIIFNLIGRPAAWIDRNVVDGLMNGLAAVTAWASAKIKGIQSGNVQDYALYFFAGIGGLAVLFIYLYT
jgi:NADH-quinone oxidoreductase subunit L